MSKGVFFTAYTYSPLHAGIGQTVGLVDLPIEREKHTNYPCVYATGLKGSLRQYWKNKNFGDLESIFGKEDEPSGAGGCVFTDLKILFFPVRSSKGTFKWVTCDRVLERFKRDYSLVFGKEPDLPKFSKLNIVETEPSDIDPDKHILLEDYMFVEDSDGHKTIQSKESLFGHLGDNLQSIYTIHDDYFIYFVQHATQITARNVLKDNKVSGNLWYEEALPADTVLYSFILPSINGNTDLLAELPINLNKKIVQIGGNETVGYGITQLQFINSNEGGDQ